MFLHWIIDWNSEKKFNNKKCISFKGNVPVENLKK